MGSRRMRKFTWMAALLGAFLVISVKAEDGTADRESGKSPAKTAALGEPTGAKRLMPAYDAWVDPVRKQVIIDGKVCLRAGQLEMFACPKNSKEHESVVAVNTKAYIIHAALLSVGAKVGRPVQFTPEYVPAAGTEIEITLHWKDEQGKQQSAKAQQWIRDAKTGKAMAHPWVFAGSGFWVDPSDGQKHYQAESGDFICVSNFPSAMLDLPIESTQSNEGLLFEPFTDRIPPIGTPVRLVLKPKVAP